MLAQSGEHPSAGLSLNKVPVPQGEPLRLEIDCVSRRGADAGDAGGVGEDGRAALQLALEINAAIHAHAERAGLKI